jgi:thioredoxin 1
MNSPKSIAFRAARVLVITAALFAVILTVFLSLQKRPVAPSPRVEVLAEGAELAPLLARTPVVLVSFGAEWCGNCKALKPHLHRLADAYAEALSVVLVDVDVHPALAKESEVKAVPDTRLYAGGKPASRREGHQTVEALTGWVTPHILSAAYAQPQGQAGHDHHGHDHDHDPSHDHGGHNHE